jgi:hypothetical protein
LPPVTAVHALDEPAGNATWTPAQRAVGKVFRQVLGVEQVGLTADFVGLGGHSLAAARVATRLSEGGSQVTVRDVFELGSIERIAALIEGGAERPAPPDEWASTEEEERL